MFVIKESKNNLKWSDIQVKYALNLLAIFYQTNKILRLYKYDQKSVKAAFLYTVSKNNGKVLN